MMKALTNALRKDQTNRAYSIRSAITRDLTRAEKNVPKMNEVGKRSPKNFKASSQITQKDPKSSRINTIRTGKFTAKRL